MRTGLPSHRLPQVAAHGGILGAAVCCAERGGDPSDDWTTCEADRDLLLDRWVGGWVGREGGLGGWPDACECRFAADCVLEAEAGVRGVGVCRVGLPRSPADPLPPPGCPSPLRRPPPACRSIFCLAKERDLDLDFHTDENGNALARGLRYVAQKAVQHGYQGRVVCGHCWCAAGVGGGGGGAVARSSLYPSSHTPVASPHPLPTFQSLLPSTLQLPGFPVARGAGYHAARGAGSGRDGGQPAPGQPVDAGS